MSGQKAGNIKRLDVAVATPLRLVQMLKENRTLGAHGALGASWSGFGCTSNSTSEIRIVIDMGHSWLMMVNIC